MFRVNQDFHIDAIESLFERAAQETRKERLNLSIGVYRDENGNAPIMECVRQAEAEAIEADATKTYRTPAGNTDYCASMEQLLLGPDHKALADGLVKTIQTPGAGAALRAAAEIIRSLAPRAKIWFSRPVWDHQIDFFTYAGLKIARYDYYDRIANKIDFDAMLASLGNAARGDIVVIHGCCHNPTGADLSLAQWRAVAECIVERGLIPLVDVAYQGFGDGVEKDVLGLRLIVDLAPEAFIVSSSSKSFCIYRDRAGVLMLKQAANDESAERVFRHALDLVRALYFMPPDHGARIVRRILSTPALEQLWRSELEAMRQSIIHIRSLVSDAFAVAIEDVDLTYVKDQKGMFSCLPISEDERRRLEIDKAIYLMPGGRINFAALSVEKIAYLAESLPPYLHRSAPLLKSA